MKNLVKILGVALVATVMATACRSSPVMNITEAPVTLSKKSTLADVKKGIIRAGINLGWQMRPLKNGHIVGTLILRTHVAKVDITYNKSSYSINYKDSSNLDYDGTNIHSNYNSWVQNLDRRIQAELSAFM